MGTETWAGHSEELERGCKPTVFTHSFRGRTLKLDVESRMPSLPRLWLLGGMLPQTKSLGLKELVTL